MAIVHTSKIEFSVELDENRVPENIHWSAEDGGIQNEASKAIMLSVWDSVQKDTLRIDLWTKDMPVDEMKQFFHLWNQHVLDCVFDELHLDIIEMQPQRDTCKNEQNFAKESHN